MSVAKDRPKARIMQLKLAEQRLNRSVRLNGRNKMSVDPWFANCPEQGNSRLIRPASERKRSLEGVIWLVRTRLISAQFIHIIKTRRAMMKRRNGRHNHHRFHRLSHIKRRWPKCNQCFHAEHQRAYQLPTSAAHGSVSHQFFMDQCRKEGLG